MTTTVVTPTPDYSAIKAKQNAARASGDYARIGVTLRIVGESLAETMDLRPGASVLDVAAGNGNATLAFARRMCTVTSTDYVETLLARGRARAEAEAPTSLMSCRPSSSLQRQHSREWSTWRHVLTEQDKAAMVAPRLPSNGKTSAWQLTPAGFIGEVFKTSRKHIAPPIGVRLIPRWGTEVMIARHSPEVARLLSATRHSFSGIPARTLLDVFMPSAAPSTKAFLALDTKDPGRGQRPARRCHSTPQRMARCESPRTTWKSSSRPDPPHMNLFHLQLGVTS
jgi:hypothetical protein